MPNVPSSKKQQKSNLAVIEKQMEKLNNTQYDKGNDNDDRDDEIEKL